MHVSTGLCVLLLLRMLVSELAASALACTWVIHPVFGPLLNNLNLIYFLWGLLFSAGALWLFLLQLRKKRALCLILSVVAFGLAVFTYRPALALPAFLVVLYLHHDTSPRAATAALVYLLLAACLLALFQVPASISYPVLFVLVLALSSAAPIKKDKYLSLVWVLLPYLAVVGLYVAVSASVSMPKVAGVALFHLKGTGLIAPMQPWFVTRLTLGGSALHAVSFGLVALAPALFMKGLAVRVATAVSLAFLLLVTVRSSVVHRDDVTYWQHLDRIAPERPNLLVNLATAYLAAGKHESAKDLLMSLNYGTELGGALETIVSARLGEAFAGLGKDKVAGYFIFAKMFATSWNFDIMKNLLTGAADFSLRMGYLAPAECWWASGLVIDPYDVRLYNALGRVLIYRNFFRAAERHFRYVLRMQPNNQEALYYLAFIAKAVGRQQDYELFSGRWTKVTGAEGQIDFRPVYETFSFDRDKLQAWFSRYPTRMLSPWQKGAGVSAPKTVRYVAISEGKTYTFPEVPVEIARHFRERGNYRSALTHLSDAYRASPNSREVVELLADTYRRLGQPQEASRLDALLPGLKSDDEPNN